MTTVSYERIFDMKDKSLVWTMAKVNICRWYGKEEEDSSRYSQTPDKCTLDDFSSNSVIDYFQPEHLDACHIKVISMSRFTSLKAL